MVYCGTRNTFSFKNSVNKGKGVGPRGAEPPRIKFCWVPTNPQPNMPQNVGSKEDLITKNIPNRTKHSTIHRQQQQQVRLLLHVISQIILSNGVQQRKVIFTKTIDCPSETILNAKLQGRLSLAIAGEGRGGTQGKLGWRCVVDAFKSWPFLRQKVVRFFILIKIRYLISRSWILLTLMRVSFWN